MKHSPRGARLGADGGAGRRQPDGGDAGRAHLRRAPREHAVPGRVRPARALPVEALHEGQQAPV